MHVLGSRALNLPDARKALAAERSPKTLGSQPESGVQSLPDALAGRLHLRRSGGEYRVHCKYNVHRR